MKIAVITLHGMSKTSVGGSSKVFFNMVNEFAKRGHEVIAIAPNIKLETEGQVKQLCCEGVQFRNEKPFNIKGLFYSKIFNKFRSIFSANRKKRRESRALWNLYSDSSSVQLHLSESKPDIIISYQQETTYLLIELLKVKIPVITMVHRAPDDYFSKPEFSMYRNALEKCKAVQVLMPEYVNQAKNYLPGANLIYIPNAVPQYTESASLDNHIIMHVGRVTNIKRQHLIVEAFKLLSKKYPDWRVEFWGATNSEYSHQLEASVKKDNLSDKISFCGLTRQVPLELKRGAIFVFPSQFEGFSLALSEAMSMGLPVIGCKECPSVNSIIHHGENGFLCEDNPEDIAKHMEYLMSDISLRQKFGARAKMDMQQFSPERIWDNWEKCLRVASGKDL